MINKIYSQVLELQHQFATDNNTEAINKFVSLFIIGGYIYDVKGAYAPEP